MAYNKAKEEKKWRLWKEAEENDYFASRDPGLSFAQTH